MKFESDIKLEFFSYEEVKRAYQARPIQYYIAPNGCHIVVSHQRDKDGYPRIKRGGKFYRLSRYIYEMHYGPIPDGMIVMHTCDDPRCNNPIHLRLGTHEENMADMMRKGRSCKGSRHPNAKLDEYAAYFIRFESDDIPIDTLAAMFNVSKDTIAEVRKGRTWQHVTEDQTYLSLTAV